MRLQSLIIGFLSLILITDAFASVVATVGNKKITLEDFKKRFDDVKRETMNPPPPEIFLEDLVRYELGVQEAEKQNLQNDPIVKERFRQELYKALLEKALSKQFEGIKISEDEMKKYYQNSPEVRTSHILIEVKPGATPEEKATARKRAEEIFSKVKKSNQPFEELVKLYTDDTISRSTGGDIGFQSRVTLYPTYYEAALKTKVGNINGLIETRYGFHIMKVTARRPYSEANRLQIRAAVFDEKRKQIFDAYFQRLKKGYQISVDEKLAKSVK